MTKRTFSRVHFCQSCYDNRRPKDGDYYFVHGSTTGDTYRWRYETPTNRRCSHIGYTPHFFEIDKLLPSGQLQIRISCGMQGCDTVYKFNKEKNQYEYFIVKEHYILLTPKEWEALETFTDSGYKL